eukprot:TRINITY_DN18546_c0_g1_i1.p1 TRINITY_DN18546_c0_g1~~TRINITY_DN18546_c0_g1_i1.p1  ORF type:complete len:153 (+),score=10.63 TRINITY_DN18546_c0_g1_i1:569-1027(+)
MILCVAVVGQASNPLYLESFTGANDTLKFHCIVHCALDVVYERATISKKPSPAGGPAANDTYLGLLCPTEDYFVYGYLSNTRVKFIAVVNDQDVPEKEMRSFFHRIHAAYIDAASNPFHVPGRRLTSPALGERIRTIVKSSSFAGPGSVSKA